MNVNKEVAQKALKEFGLDKLLKSTPFFAFLFYLLAILFCVRYFGEAPKFMYIDNKMMNNLLSPNLVASIVAYSALFLILLIIYPIIIEKIIMSRCGLISDLLNEWIAKPKVDNRGFVKFFILPNRNDEDYGKFAGKVAVNYAKFITVDLLSVLMFLLAIYNPDCTETFTYKLLFGLGFACATIVLFNNIYTVRKGYRTSATVDIWHNDFSVVQEFRGTGEDTQKAGKYQLLSAGSQGVVYYVIFIPDDQAKNFPVNADHIFENFAEARAYFDYLKENFSKEN